MNFSIPYSSVLQEPGYNVIESIPGEKLKNLPFAYQELGFQKIELLNKTDIKWLIEKWGEPTAHTTLHEMHINVWHQYENKLKKKQTERTKNPDLKESYLYANEKAQLELEQHPLTALLIQEKEWNVCNVLICHIVPVYVFSLLSRIPLQAKPRVSLSFGLCTKSLLIMHAEIENCR